MVNVLDIGTRKIGPGHPCFVIAEAGVNHNGDLKLARQLIEVAAAAGADAVKFQTFKAKNLVTATAPKAEYQKQNTGNSESQFEMLNRLELPYEAHHELMAHARERGILFLSTPFDEESADFLAGMGLPLFKMPSGELTNLPFLEHVARKQKPMIISTGMSTLGEVELAVQTVARSGNRNMALLQCTSNYPTNPAEVNLRAMNTMSVAFGLPVGFSDHTEGNEVPFAAVAMGACIVEKHFTLDKNLPGPDHVASLEPEELHSLVKGIRIVESALGDGIKVPAASERNTAEVARKSIVAACAIPANTEITAGMLRMSRPGTGLPSTMLPQLIGRKSSRPIASGALLALDSLS